MNATACTAAALKAWWHFHMRAARVGLVVVSAMILAYAVVLLILSPALQL